MPALGVGVGPGGVRPLPLVAGEGSSPCDVPLPEGSVGGASSVPGVPESDPPELPESPESVEEASPREKASPTVVLCPPLRVWPDTSS